MVPSWQLWFVFCRLCTVTLYNIHNTRASRVQILYVQYNARRIHENAFCALSWCSMYRKITMAYYYQYILMCYYLLYLAVIAQRTSVSAFLRGRQTRRAAGAAADERVRVYTRTLTRSCPVIRRVIRAFKSLRFPRAPIRPGPYIV